MEKSQYLTVVAVMLLFTTSLCLLPVSAANDTDSVPNSANQNNVSALDRENASTRGSTTEIFVRLDDPHAATIAASERPIETMRSESAHAQTPVLNYADATAGVDVLDTFWITNAVLLEVETSSADLEYIKSMDAVERVHGNYKIATQSTGASSIDPRLKPRQAGNAATSKTYTYGLQQIDVPNAWAQYDTKGETATVAVLDSGVDASAHPDLRPAAGGWKDFVAGRANPYDDETGHGTHVTGTVVGEQITDGTLAGTQYGVAPKAELLHGRVSNGGRANFDDLISGMEWAVKQDADVVSISLGAAGYYTAFIEPIQNANAAGTVVVASAGNTYAGSSTSPGNVYDAISVGASREDETIASFSGGETIQTIDAWGEKAPSEWPDEYIVPDVAAPGAGVYSANVSGGYVSQSGTSMAAPHVTGIVALMEGATVRDLTPAEIKSNLSHTTRTPPVVSGLPDERYGHGIVNASAAVAAVATPPDFRLGDLTAPTTTAENSSYEISVPVTNRGDTPGVRDITYELRNASGSAVVTQNQSLDLSRNTTTETEFAVPETATVSQTGSYTHVVSTPNDTRTRSVELTAAYTVDRYRSGGRVTPRGLGDAARDFRDGLITPRLLGDVAAAFRTS